MGESKLRRAFGPPLSYFWIVEWVDGRALSQYDTRTGMECLFSEVVKRNVQIRRAAWMPFPDVLAKKLELRGERVLRLPVKALIGMEIPPDGALLLRKRVFLPLGIGRRTKSLGVAVYVVGYRRGAEQALRGVDGGGRRVSEKMMDKIGWSIQGISPKGELHG